jgi:hypothetical protein
MTAVGVITFRCGQYRRALQAQLPSPGEEVKTDEREASSLSMGKRLFMLGTVGNVAFVRCRHSSPRGFWRWLQHLIFQELQVTDSYQRQKPGPGKPLTTQREHYFRLMKQGLNNSEACRLAGIHRKTGQRWRHGRRHRARGREYYYRPITAPQHRSRHRLLPTIHRAPTRPGPPSATTTGQVGCRCRVAHNGPTAAGPVVESRADQPRAAHPLPGPAGEASGARDHLSGDLRARTWRVAP